MHTKVGLFLITEHIVVLLVILYLLCRLVHVALSGLGRVLWRGPPWGLAKVGAMGRREIAPQEQNCLSPRDSGFLT